MSNIQVKSHLVTALRVTGISSLKRGSQMMTPDSGVALSLEDGTKRDWLIEGKQTPAVGSFVIQDNVLHAQYLVTAEQFAELFEVMA